MIDTELRLRVGTFDGPFDLLLHLCRTNEIDLAALPVRSITDQYLAHLEAIEFRDLETAGAYLVMAATLIYLKSKLLVPPDESDEQLDDEGLALKQELEDRLREYARVKTQGAWLAAREAEMALIWGRPGAMLPAVEDLPLEDLSVDWLARAMTRLIDEQRRARPRSVEPNPPSVIERMKKRLDAEPDQAARVRAVVPDTAFVIAGEGELRENLRELAEQLGIRNDVFFIGRCEDVASLLFASDVPLEAERIREVLDLENAAAARELVGELVARYEAEERGLAIMETGGGWRMVTQPELAPWLVRLARARTRVRLSRAALETLAIVAYKQPVSRPEIDAVRGVNSDATLDNLLERRLLRIAGRKEAPGRPFVYETTREFLVAFGLRDPGDLPKIEGELVIPDLAAEALTVDGEAQAQQDPGAGGAQQPTGS